MSRGRGRILRAIRNRDEQILRMLERARHSEPRATVEPDTEPSSGLGRGGDTTGDT
jgi:hypothetical protein